MNFDTKHHLLVLLYACTALLFVSEELLEAVTGTPIAIERPLLISLIGILVAGLVALKE